MKAITLGALALCLAPTVSAALYNDARSSGMAGAGVASGDFTRSHLNPALLTRFEEGEDLYLQLGLGILARDYEDTLDDLDALQENLDAFESLINGGDPSQLPAAERLKEEILGQLNNLDQSRPQIEGSVGLGAFLPGKRLGFGLSTQSHFIGNGLVNYDARDEQLLEEALMGLPFDQDKIRSSTDANAVAVTELRLSFARHFEIAGTDHFSVGVAPKFQRIDSYYYNATVSNFDEDEITSDDNLTDQSGLNLDIGIQAGRGPWQFGLVGRDLFKQTLENVNQQTLELLPTLIGAAAFQQGGVTAALDLDLIPDESFAQIQDPSQWARFGIEYDFWGHAQLRAGYRHDLEGNYEDLLTLGLGLSPGDLITLDLAAQLGDDDDLGVQLQLGLKL